MRTDWPAPGTPTSFPGVQRLAYVHWHAEEAAQRAAKLAAAGYAVEVFSDTEATNLSALRDPDLGAILIDLGRLPSHGRQIALALRAARATRHTPLVFFIGDLEKTKRVQADLPDATFTTWRMWKRALRDTLAAPPANPIVPRSTSGYSGTPLWKKLGAKEGATVLLLDAPPEFEPHLAALPAGVEVRRRAGAGYALGLCFCRTRIELTRRWPGLERDLAPGGSVWIAWPKLSSGQARDLSGDVVRASGLERGLVDTKVCAVDAVWSALRFQRRRPK